MTAAGIAVALAIAASALALAAPGAAQAFTWEGHCDQVGAAVLADAAVVREHVPAGWPLHEAAGKVVLFVTGGACRDQRVSGSWIGDSHFGLVSVQSRHPDNAADPSHGYDIWWFNSDRRVARAMAEAGITTPYVRDTQAATTFGPLGATGGELTVPWRRSPYTVRVIPGPVGTPPAPFAFTSFHWHVGRYGRVLFTPEHTGFTATAGIGVVEATANSPIARMIGGTSTTGAGVLFSFDFAGAAGPA